MIESTKTTYEGLQCIQLKNDFLAIWVTRDVGPRILGLSFLGGKNMLAVLPGEKIPVTGADDYSLRGGHRLWYAPEKPETTYIADDQPVEISILEHGLEAIRVVDQATGIQKSWRVTLSDSEAELTIDHKLTNKGSKDFQLAPWAVTMLKPGGQGVIPLQTELDDEHGLWPNRQLVFWPYTDLRSPYLDWHDQGIMVKANMTEGALKMGAPNPGGWMAYNLEGSLFVKRTEYQAGDDYLDRGASSQIYCNPDLIELETLGPVVTLAPGEFSQHQETWQIYAEGNWPGEIKQLFDLFQIQQK
ncbi:MAG: hypothetical protein DRI65_07200 [Chloroflexota bacterium]|nr:MAG: hypothetical protein DRI65_07200 [Chloroflexota bacterium]HDD62552.1 hypothetical protein [Chloroflexota bacterium]